MAKKPQDGMDEESIIRRRDGVGGGASDEPLDTEAKRAMADARLRALAFALGSAQSPRVGAEELDDSELLAYLLDTLPEPRRTALEEALRGNADAFGRLMTLRNAFSSQTDKRDRQRTDDPTRHIPRHTVGRVDIRRMGEILQFKDATRVRPSLDIAQLKPAAAAFELREYRPSNPQVFRQIKGPGFEWGAKTEIVLRDLLARARHDLDAGMRLVNESQSLLESWWNSIRREETETREGGGPEVRHAEKLREHLTQLLSRLEIFANRINEELRDVASAAGVLPAIRGRALQGASDALFEGDPVARLLSDDWEMWADIFDLEAGPWALHLAGTATPIPQLTVFLRANRVGIPSVEPFLTLVRPAEGFETVVLDSSSSGKVALPAGESVILLQADEIWEVHLSFRERK